MSGRSARPSIACTLRPSKPGPLDPSYSPGVASGYAVKQAADLMDAAFLARWTDREAIGPLARQVLGVILRRLAAGEGALSVTGLLPDHAPAEVAGAVAELDRRDLVLVEAGAVVLAYPVQRPNERVSSRARRPTP